MTERVTSFPDTARYTYELERRNEELTRKCVDYRAEITTRDKEIDLLIEVLSDELGDRLHAVVERKRRDLEEAAS